ncbi:type VI secretion system contractile sheath domain-containing protein [Vibrio fluvialis]|uniref:type VI secretion system contractile sheath domain-containing protein n=3 Tax=Vibrio fluvialis TaxID=676 RepID=UPI001D03B295|nr:type VI secretion system contractile sheath large subunit [Vibrio fluvialis]
MNAMFDADFQHAFCQLNPEAEDFLPQALAQLLKLDPQMLSNREVLLASLLRLIAEIDDRMSRQLSTVIHHPDFSRLEASWKGVEALVSLPVNYQKVQIKIRNMSWEDLSQELNTAVSLRRTSLYNLIGNRELNTSGGQPFGMVVVDHALSMSLDGDYDDLYTLELLSQLGDLCLCPFILSPSDDFFGESGADWFSDIERVKKILHGPEFVAWQRVRRMSSARFIGLVVPKIRLREAYGRSASSAIQFREYSANPAGLWGSAAYLFASVAIREFNRINWFGFMKSRWQDKYYGSLGNVPPGGAGVSATLRPTPDIRLITEMGTFYADEGFIPLCHSLTTDKYFFRGNNSIWSEAKDDTESVMGQIQTTLMICRIAHYLKVQIRSMIGNFQTAEECETYLNRWLDKYSSNLFNADEATLAKYPLSKGRVEVREIDGQHGRYTCDVFVQPQYQFDNVCGEVLLSTDLGPEREPRFAGGLV